MDRNVKVPTYFGVNCTNCQSTDFQVVGQKGSQLRTLTGNAGVLNSGSLRRGLSNSIEEYPLIAKCRNCKQRFMIVPKIAEGDELLVSPATLNITREKSIMGFAVNSFIMINGIMSASVKNGETVKIETNSKHNYVQMFDMNGLAFKSEKNVVVSAGDIINISLSRKRSK